MTSQQKAQIEKLRSTRIGFKVISERTGIPVTTIKSYCYRHPVQVMPVEPEAGLCPQCGQPVPQMHFKPRRFCSDACRIRYWHQHTDEMKKRSDVECRCQQCGKSFYDYAARGRKYCSLACYIAARYGGERHG